MGGNWCSAFSAAAAGSTSGKTAWNSDFLGSRHKPSNPAAAATAGTAVHESWAQLAAVLGAPGTAPGGLLCGVWVTAATDVSCFSDLGCIFVGSAVIWGAGWRRWAWSGEDLVWDELVEPKGWGEGLGRLCVCISVCLGIKFCFVFPFHSAAQCFSVFLNSEKQKDFLQSRSAFLISGRSWV